MSFFTIVGKEVTEAELKAHVKRIPLLHAPYVALVAGRCGRCKWWDHKSPDTFGSCRALDDDDQMLAYLDSDCDTARFRSRADFGCLLFEAKSHNLPAD